MLYFRSLCFQNSVGLSIAALAFIYTTVQTTATASATTAPIATPTPLFSYSANLKASYGGRTSGNSCLTCKPAGVPDNAAFNFGGQIHVQLKTPHSPWTLGATYFGAFPFGTNWAGPLNNIGYNPLVDNSLPGYTLNVMGEAYIQYKTSGIFAQTGKEVLSAQQSPWTPSADVRMEPFAFQGTLINTNVGRHLNVAGMYMARFKSRITSAFDANSLLTSCNTAFNTGKGPVEGVPGTFTVLGDPCNKLQKTRGFLELAASSLGDNALTANVNVYQIYDIAHMTWVTAQYAFDRKSPLNPFVGGQFLTENSTGSALVGTIHNYTAGGQFGATIHHNLTFVASYDGSVATAYVVRSNNCKGTVNVPQAASPGVIFGGVADTSAKGLPPGEVLCYGGGLASPYTDSYAADPLFTTQIGQGLADVHKPGTAVKAALTWYSNDKRLRLIASDAWFNFGLPGRSSARGNGDARNEFDADVTYYFNPVVAGTYKGFSLRLRYWDRTQSFSPFEYKYCRTQLQYTF